MKGSRFFRRFSLKWSVEGPLEGLFDLTQELMGYRSDLNKFIISTIAVSLFFVVFFITSISTQIINFYFEIINILQISEILFYIFRIFGTVILTAIAIFLLVIIFQSYRFFEVLNSRFEGVRDLWTSSEDIDDYQGEDMSEFFGADPYRSSISFTEDVSIEIPQLIKQLNYSSRLFVITFVILAVDFTLHISLITSEPGFFLPSLFGYGIVWKSIELVMIVLSIFGWLAATNLKDFLDFFYSQNDVVDRIRKNKTPFVPEGKDKISRFKKYLIENDELLRSSLDTHDKKIVSYSKLEGISGEQYEFDLMYDPGTDMDYILLVKGADSEDIDIELLGDYKKHVNDVIKGLEEEYGERPEYLRAVILTEEEDEYIDLDEELIDYILDNPINLRKGPGGGSMIAHIQIVIEEGETYSVFPFLPENKTRWR